ncbi:ribokinase [soil metagenome]
MTGSIVVVGSTNTDMVIKTDRFPQPGETLLGGEFFLNPGGKGANQAVAAARLGGQVTFVAKVGIDLFGQQAREQFRNEGIVTDYISTDPERPSGVALITVDGKGENTIVVASGANGTLSPQDLAQAQPAIYEAEVLLLQLESPMVTVSGAARMGANAGARVILNPAPAATLPDDLFPTLFLITPNRSEAEALTGVKINTLADAEAAARKLQEKGVANVVVTMGSEGAYLLEGEKGTHVPAPVVTPLDSTAAGDVFNGALAVGLAEGLELEEAVRFASQVAAISVTRLGAQASAPYRHEVSLK